MADEYFGHCTAPLPSSLECRTTLRDDGTCPAAAEHAAFAEGDASNYDREVTAMLAARRGALSAVQADARVGHSAVVILGARLMELAAIHDRLAGLGIVPERDADADLPDPFADIDTPKD
jgi:hypothetical protein